MRRTPRAAARGRLGVAGALGATGRRRHEVVMCAGSPAAQTSPPERLEQATTHRRETNFRCRACLPASGGSGNLRVHGRETAGVAPQPLWPRTCSSSKRRNDPTHACSKQTSRHLEPCEHVSRRCAPQIPSPDTGWNRTSLRWLLTRHRRARRLITSPVDTDGIPLLPRLRSRRTEGAAGPRRRPPRGERCSGSSLREARSTSFPAC